jgi:hypothetical protein
VTICVNCRNGGRLQQEAEDHATLCLDKLAPPRRVPDPALVRAAAEWHAACRGGSHCDCQHLPGTMIRADRKPDPRRGA